MKTVYIINPRSGKQRNKSALEACIDSEKDAHIEIVYTEYAGHAAELAEQSVGAGYNSVVAIGGDGTMNEVASQLVGTKVNFGLVPMGSGNGFARSLGLPLNPLDALKIIRQKKIRRIDVGQINKKYFFAVAGVGLDASVAERFQKSTARGALPYFYLTFKEFIKYTYPEYTIDCDEFKGSVKPLALTIANATQFGNGAQIAPQAALDDGYLDLCVIKKATVIQSLLHINKLFNGTIDKAPFYTAYKSKRIEIMNDWQKRIPFHTDGEPHIGESPFLIEIKPQSLNVLAV